MALAVEDSVKGYWSLYGSVSQRSHKLQMCLFGLTDLPYQLLLVDCCIFIVACSVFRLMLLAFKSQCVTMRNVTWMHNF